MSTIAKFLKSPGPLPEWLLDNYSYEAPQFAGDEWLNGTKLLETVKEKNKEVKVAKWLELKDASFTSERELSQTLPEGVKREVREPSPDHS